MQPCNRIYYSTVHWRLNMFWSAYRSSSGALTVFEASGLHKHVVTGRSQVWVGTHWRLNMFRSAYRSSWGTLYLQPVDYIRMWWPAVVKSEWELRLDHGRSPHAYVIHRLQIQLELLMMSDMPLETCWAFNERWNNKFCYKVASCWLFLLGQQSFGTVKGGCVSRRFYFSGWLGTGKGRIFWRLGAGSWPLW
jgi:hypothetical protein